MQDRIERIVPVQKAGGSFRRHQRIYVDPDTGLATPDAEHFRGEESVKHPLVALAAADAKPTDFTVEARVPLAEPGGLRVVQIVKTGRETADGREIVRPILVNRKFKPGDRPENDRHPVEFLEERDRVLQQSAAPPADLEVAVAEAAPPAADAKTKPKAK